MKFVVSPLSFKKFIYAVSITLILGIIIYFVTIILQQTERDLHEKKITAYKLQSSIKHLKHQLERKHQDLITLFNIANDTNTSALHDMEKSLNFYNKHVFASPIIKDLKLYEVIAKKILNKNDYIHALPELTKIMEGYQKLNSILDGSYNTKNINCTKIKTVFIPRNTNITSKNNTNRPNKRNTSINFNNRKLNKIPSCYFEYFNNLASNYQKYVGEMALIPAGDFKMGSNNGSFNEKPIHRVYVNSFKLMVKEVTFNQYDAYVKDINNGQDFPNDEGWGRGNRPVININWHQARDYAKWLTLKTGSRFRLPTEAEWEYAARAQSNNKYTWGDYINCSQANYNNNGKCGNSHQTMSVGSFKPNSFGIYDMHGNVLEWVQDCWNSNYNSAPSNGKGWFQGECEKRVLRGGSWFYSASYLRSAARNWAYAAHSYLYFGFRLIQE